MNQTTPSNHSGYEAYTIICSGAIHVIPLCNECKVSIYVASLLVVLLIIPTVFLNLIAFVVIVKTKKLFTPSNVLIASTAVCDFLSAIISMLLWILTWLFGLQKKHYCVIYLSAVFASHALSFLSFLLVNIISLDRYLALFKPFFYKHRVSGNLIYYVPIMVALSFVVLILNVASFVTPEKQIFQDIILVSLPPFMLHGVYSHFKILYKVKNISRKNTRKRSISSCSLPTSNSENKNNFILSTVSCLINSNAVICSVFHKKKCSHFELPSEMKNSKEKLKQINISYLTFFLLASFYLCYTPYVIVTATRRINPSIKKVQWIHVAFIWSYPMICIKSLVNPILYCYRVRLIKEQVKRQTLKIKICNN
ncbi:5-hydroxytryptamine receptor 1F-like [Hydra vulgaris]|uniref:5-hydroxytryptamine receptor 1F-like n=1 Tax=Hydra vulgaris TaxID=6087 RepID=UPI0032EA890A